MLSRVIGQEAAKKKLILAFQTQRLAHAYLITGDDGLGADELALEFAMYCLCQERNQTTCESCKICRHCRRISSFEHPDVHYYFPTLKSTTETEIRERLEAKSGQFYSPVKVEGGTIHIGDPENPEGNSIRGLLREMAMRSVEGNFKVFVLSHVEDMNAESANALLKALEEPPPATLFFLTTAQPHSLLPTILSRCQVVKLQPILETEIEQSLCQQGAGADEARLVARLSNGNMGQALRLLSGELMRRRDLMLDFLVALLAPQRTSMVEVVEKLIAEGRKDKSVVTDVLTLAIAWFEDALYVLHEVDSSNIVNQDKVDRLRKFLINFPQTNVEKTVFELEKAVDLISRNVYLNLILINLGITLRRLITKGQ